MAQLRTATDLLSVEDYLAGENDGTVRHEFVNGMVYAMAGASERHTMIKLNVAGLLNSTVDENCRVFDGDMKLNIIEDADQRFYYPDVFVACGSNDDAQHARNDAVLVIEVLSPSTRRLDRYEKFDAYKQVPSLAEYLLIEQQFAQVEVFRRSTGWLRERYLPGDIVDLSSIGEQLTFDQIYRRVTFGAAANPRGTTS
jgi:Uma2 family endonuclease